MISQINFSRRKCMTNTLRVLRANISWKPPYSLLVSFCRCCSESARVRVHCRCIVFPSYFTSYECNHRTAKITRTKSGLFFFTQIPWDVASKDLWDGVSHWLWHKLKQDVRSIEDKKALCTISLCLDTWCAPVLITTIKHRSKLHHPSLEAEYAWRLTQTPYCKIIT